jgi:hypothetical protein
MAGNGGEKRLPSGGPFFCLLYSFREGKCETRPDASAIIVDIAPHCGV